MKKYLIFFFAMLMATSSLVLTGCSSDDDENADGTNYSEMIVGSWKWRFSLIDGDEWYGESYTRFYPDGTYKEVNITVYYDNIERETDSGSWSISGNKLIMDGVEDISTISKLTDSEMVVSVAGQEFARFTKVSDSVFEQYYNQK